MVERDVESATRTPTMLPTPAPAPIEQSPESNKKRQSQMLDIKDELEEGRAGGGMLTRGLGERAWSNTCQKAAARCSGSRFLQPVLAKQSSCHPGYSS